MIARKRTPWMRRRFMPSRRRFLAGTAWAAVAAAAWPLRGAAAATVAGGPHHVVMTVVDKDHTWRAQAQVGDDPTVAATYVRFTDEKGNRHRGLDAWFYADCVEAGATSLDNAYDYINIRSVTVTYDGRDVPVPRSSKKDGTYDFWRGCRCPAIRYGKQVGWSAAKIDRSLLPSYAREAQAPWDDSRMDYSFNGLGNATTRTMGQGGARADLGYMSVWNMAFLTDPSDATWAVIRRSDDHIGWWRMVYTSDPATGGIVDMYKYPGTSTLPQAQVHAWKNNALVPYGGSYDGDTLIVGKAGPKSWLTSASPDVPDGAHLTSYAVLSAMVTGTARDRDHASFWANWTILEIGVPYTMARGCADGVQRRFAWCLRTLFMASYVSSERAYFAKEVARNLPIAMAHATNPWGAYDTVHAYPRIAVKNGGQIALAPWMQYYLATTMDAVAHKLPEWMPFARYLARYMMNWADQPYAFLASIYTWVVRAPDGKQTVMHDFQKQTEMSLVEARVPEPDARAITSGTTVAACHAAYRKAVPGWPGRFANGYSDFAGRFESTDAYPSMCQAAIVCAYNTGIEGREKLLAWWKGVPTRIDYKRDCKFNLVPRT